LTEPSPTRPRLDSDRWLRDHGDYLYRYARVRLHDDQLAEEAVQETLVSALSGQSRFAGRSSERTWLTGILRHKIVDQIRRRVREQPMDVASDPIAGVDGDFDETGHWKQSAPAAWPDNPENSFSKQQFWAQFQACIGRLKPNLRAAFVLRELEEKSSEEICNILNVSSTNLWVILHRARHHLRKCLETHWFSAESRP